MRGADGRRLGTPAESCSRLDAAAREKIIEAPGGAPLFSMPLYGGIIPKLCAAAAVELEGRGASAFAARCSERREPETYYAA